MSAAKALAKQQVDRILEESIARRRCIVLTHNSPQGWRMFKSKFVSGSASSRVILVDGPSPAGDTVTPLPEPGDELGVTFRLRHKKCVVGTGVESIEHRETNGALALHWPDHLQQVRRRAFERAEVPKDRVAAVRLWNDAGTGGTGVEARTVRHGQLENLSAGGMCVRVPSAQEFAVGTTCRCAFTPRPGKPSLIGTKVLRKSEM